MIACVRCGAAIPKPKDRKVQANRKFCSIECYRSREPRPIADRFWEKVDRAGDCWVWTAATNPVSGYGAFGIDRETMRPAHRVAWELTNGPIPPGLVICHKCDNRPCVRPDHLFLGTIGDNNRDMFAKGRNAHEQPKLRGSLNRQARLTEDQVRAIRVSTAKRADLARTFGVSATLIRYIQTRRWWAWLDAEVPAA